MAHAARFLAENRACFPLSKFFNLLKARGRQTCCIALAASLFLCLSNTGVLPGLEPWMVVAGWVVILLCGALAVASLAPAAPRRHGES